MACEIYTRPVQPEPANRPLHRTLRAGELYRSPAQRCVCVARLWSIPRRHGPPDRLQGDPDDPAGASRSNHEKPALETVRRRARAGTRARFWMTTPVLCPYGRDFFSRSKTAAFSARLLLTTREAGYAHRTLWLARRPRST